MIFVVYKTIIETKQRNISMTHLTVKKANEISADFLKEIQKIAEKHGVTVRAAGGKVMDTEAKLHFVINTISESGEIETKEAKALKQIYPGMYGKVFNFNGDKFKITGYSTRSYKRPFLAMNIANNKTYKFTEQAVKNVA
jgi:hypothetical protein